MKSYRFLPTSLIACLSCFVTLALPSAAQSIAANEWTWTGGGADTSTNPPAKRLAATSWTDGSGNFWLFGGSGVDSAGNSGYFNDLWEFVPASNAWTQISGDKLTGITAKPVYGTLGTPAAANNPGDRDSAVSWTDSSGNLWLFGGENASYNFLNDLWEFTPSTKEWTWMGGNDNSTAPANQRGQPGVYGTLGSFASGNIPGGRLGSASWTDKNGNFWLFGGYGVDSIIYWGYLSDLWEFNPTTNQWAWMGGSETLPGVNQANPGVWGTVGTAAATNIPGGRTSPLSWYDNSGNLWLFGGEALTQRVVTAFSTTCGSTILRRSNGRGSAEATPAQAARLECTAHWERLPRETFPDTAISLLPGPTRAAISGFLAAMEVLSTTLETGLTTFGSTIQPRTSGHG